MGQKNSRGLLRERRESQRDEPLRARTRGRALRRRDEPSSVDHDEFRELTRRTIGAELAELLPERDRLGKDSRNTLKLPPEEPADLVVVRTELHESIERKTPAANLLLVTEAHDRTKPPSDRFEGRVHRPEKLAKLAEVLVHVPRENLNEEAPLVTERFVEAALLKTRRRDEIGDRCGLVTPVPKRLSCGVEGFVEIELARAGHVVRILLRTELETLCRNARLGRVAIRNRSVHN